MVTSLVSCKKQWEIMPLSESLAVLRTMDEIRRRWGVRYPGD